MSSSSETQKSICKMPGKRKRASNFCSTPVMENARRLSSISISAVDTNSSSSTKRRTLEVDSRRKRIKKKRLQKNSLEQRKGKQVRKTSKKMGEGKRRKNKLIEQRISDGDWETCDESLRQSIEFETNVLFKDIQSPEHIRDAPRFVPDYLDSPIVRVRGWEVDSPQISFEENEEKLLVKDLPFSRVQFDNSDDEGDVLTLKKDNTLKTYPGLKNKKLQKDNTSIEKCKAWLVNVSVPTISSDLLWEDFVRNNYDEVAKYLAPSSNDTQRYDYCREKNIGTDEDEYFEKEDNYGEQPLKWRDKIPFDDNIKIWRGYWDKSLCKWIRIHDIYNFQEKTDTKLKMKRMHNTHITLNQFLQKKKAKRRNTAELGSSSSALYSSNIREIFVEKKERKKKRFHQNSECEKLDVFRIQRTNVRKFVSQLNVKKKTMCSNESSTVSTLKSSKPNSVLKTANGDEVYEKDDTKRIRLTVMKNKPKINSVKLLTSARFKKDKQNWRIVKNLV